MPFKDVNGTKEWKPFEKQEQFIQIPDTVFEGFYGGAAGGGKSEVLLMLPIVRGFYDLAGFHGVIFRRTFPQLEESLIPRSHEMYNFIKGSSYNETKKLWTFETSDGGVSRIRFRFIERDEDVLEHDTAEFNYVAFDELTHFTEYQYSYMTSRVRSSRQGLPAIVRSASNPGNIGHHWVRERFVSPARAGHVILYDGVTKTKRVFIPSKVTDNIYMEEIDPGYKDRLALLPEAERKAKAEGDWWSFSGQVFSEFRYERLLSEPENAVHVIEPFDIPTWWPKFVAIDWGFAHKTAVLWCAIAPDGRTIIYREYSAQNTHIRIWASDIVRLSQYDEGIRRRVIDPSARQQRGLDKTIWEQVIESTGWNDIEVADNDRIGGKMVVHEMLRWEPRRPKYIPKEGYNHEVGMRVWRMHGEAAYRDYQRAFQPDPPEKNIPKLQIFNTCTELINVIPLCVYEDKTNNTEDVKKFDGDDFYDCLRYLLKATDGYDRELAQEFKRREAIGQVVQEFNSREATTESVTSFYRKMEKLDAKNKAIVAVISDRFGKRLVRK